MYEFELPLSKLKVQWKPLTVGQQVDQVAMFPGAQSAYLGPALYAARIIQASGKSVPGYTLGEIKTWEAIDYDCFCEHVDGKENERYRQFRKTDGGMLHSILLDKYRNDLAGKITEMMRIVDQCTRVVQEAEAKGNVPAPLQVSATSSAT